MNIYVGNLAHATTDADLRAAFAAFGAVQSVRVIYDQTSGRSRGFAFVEMNDDREAGAAIAALAQVELHGRKLRLSQAESNWENRDGDGDSQPA